MNALQFDRQAARGRPAKAAATPREVFSGLALAREAARHAVLAIIVGLAGTGARAAGTPMAIFDDGSSAGTFSSGCVEAAIVAEALDVMNGGIPRTVRFGHGSPYIDIKLPCGGGMDVLFIPDPPTRLLRAVAAAMDSRRPVHFWIGNDGTLLIEDEGSSDKNQALFHVRYAPALKIVLVGHGAELSAALDLALVYGAEVEVHSPDAEIVADARERCLRASLLQSATAPFAMKADPWTGVLFLFHDHDWELPLLEAALATPSFWIGAMGSRGTHAARLSALAAAGFSIEALSRIKGPIGLISSARDPRTLALSALAEIVAAYQTFA